MKKVISISVCVLLMAAVIWFFCRNAVSSSPAGKSGASASAAGKTSGVASRTAQSTAGTKNSGTDTNSFANRLAFRLTNTSKTIGQLQRDRHAILLENAFIDTSLPLSLNIPSHLQPAGDPGTYIVQANGRIDSVFRAVLAAAGAQVVSYIPNNAYLVRLNAGGAKALTSNPSVQTVLPYEPYYKISSAAPVKISQAAAAYSPTQKAETNMTTLLQLAVAQKSLPPGTYLTLGLFGDDAAATITQIEKLGAKILSEDRSPFGKIVRVQPPVNWTALANLSGVQLVEPAYRRKLANDLARVTVGVSTDTITNANYLGLTGKNVMVEVNDTGIDPTHPDFTATGTAQSGPGGATRVTGDTAGSLWDTDGHGTHVAGIIAGNGSASYSPTAVGAVLAGLNFGSVSNADFRGKAPLANLFSVGGIDGGNDTNPPVPISDSYFQEAPALTNALISNNSWANSGDNAYDLSAASYDAATRDALPGVTGSQPVLFVFAAGNDGAGSDDGGASSSGTPDSITSPGTAKNVITVGALEQPRNITNVVTVVDGGATNSSPYWLAATDTGYQVASYSSRGNVGIETEGTYGRFKPDVVAPGTFVVSTRSSMWDTNAYYNNPTNYTDAPFSPYTFQTVTPGTLNNYFTQVPDYAVGVYIQIVQNVESTSFFTNLPLFISMTNFYPSTTNYDIYSDSNSISIPPDTGGTITDVVSMRGGTLNIDVGNNSSQPVNYDLYIVFATTNNVGDYYQVLEGLNNQIGPDYRYESGTSMATPSVSGVLADMQDFFTNTLHTVPSPALLKALLINGSRATAGYNYQVQNAINFEGWGLVNLPNSIPATLTNSAVTNMFFVDQSPTNALATGDRQTYGVVLSPGAENQSFRVTLAWTDPPGNPAAAIKLVNNLELVVTNLDDTNNPIIFYGNDIAGGQLFNSPETTNTPAASKVDTINNVQNVYIPAGTGTNFTVTVIGAAVNVNAVNAQTNDWTSGTYAPNIVQDFALVIASGDGANTNSFTITGIMNVINPLNGQDITIISTNNSPLLNQFAGANSPELGTNTATFTAGSAGALYGSQAVVTIGQTNQCHFYIVTNNGLDASTGLIGANVTNAAFVTFSPATAAIPREGVYADTDANSTRPEADVDVFVTTDSNLLTLSPITISNCINSGQLGASINTGPGSAFQGSSLSRGGSEFVVDTNSQLGEVYYVCVMSADQMAAEYDYLAEFSSIPFSSMNNGDETVNFFPVIIPGGTSTHPGVTNTLGLAMYPVDIQRVVVTNYFNQQNGGDIIESLGHSSSGAGNDLVVLYNHESPNQAGIFTNIYDDSGQGDIPGALPSAGPGTLKTYLAQQGTGVWLLNGSDDALGFNTTISATMFIQHHQDLKNPNIVTYVVPGNSWVYGYVDVPVGTVNLTVLATNVSLSLSNIAIATPPLEMYLNYGSQPTFNPSNYLAEADLTNSSPGGIDPWNQISTGPPLTPGIYYVGIYNPSFDQQVVQVTAIFPFNAAAISTNTFVSAGPVPILDDAVTYDSIFVTNTDTIQGINVGLRVDHPRISDLAFTLIDPSGDRYLLMENRGGTTTNGCGATVFYTNNIADVNASGTTNASTNIVYVSQSSGVLPISWNFYNVPDQMTVYDSTNDFSPANLIFNTTMVGGTGQTNLVFNTADGGLAIIINQFGNTNVGGDAWTFTAGGVATNYYYLTFTEDTNLTITPIKFAPPPFVPTSSFSTNFILSDFESTTGGDYVATSSVGGWQVVSNQVSLVNNPAYAYQGSKFLALANGVVSNNIPTVPGGIYTLTFAYRGPAIADWWRGESNANDSISANNGGATNVNYINGEVGQAFSFAGVSNFVNVPDSPALDSFTTNITIECWMKSDQLGNNPGWYGLITKGTFSWRLQATSFANTVYLGLDNVSPVDLYGTRNVNDGQWHHIAAVYDGSTASLYVDGTLDVSHPATGSIAQTTEPLCIGATQDAYLPAGGNALSYFFPGAIDEASVYHRALSASEIKAIYQNGIAGKFDQSIFAVSPAMSLAEANVSAGGINNKVIGNNTNWQQQTISFIATGASTPVVITGLEPGMLLDEFSVSGVGTSNNLYYQPEQPLTPLVGTSAYGNWQLEILDSRAGATNNAVLDSWELQFIFANTNYTLPPPIILLTNNIAQTNTASAGCTVPGGSYTWYQVNVPINVDSVTNSLLSADLPLNVWFSTNLPPTTNSLGDIMLISNSTNSGVLLNSSTVPAIVPGETYYLGVQNTNCSAVNYGIEINYHFISTQGPFAFTQPATFVTGTGAQLNGMATPNGYPTYAWYEWGTNNLYGNQTLPVSVGSGNSVVYVINSITNLISRLPYHFRLVVSNGVNGASVARGFDQILGNANEVAWGAGYIGQTAFQRSLTNYNVTAIAGAYDHSMALMTNGNILAWGDNAYGQTNVPAYVTNVVAIAGGQYYSMALIGNGTVAAWGGDVFGTPTNIPPVLTNSATADIVSIAGGTYAETALKNDGTVISWGINAFNLTNVPAGLSNVVAVAGGSFHSLAIKNDGTVTGWGDNSDGQLNVPVGLSNVVAVAAGEFYSLALRANGTVMAWGDDSVGQTNVPLGLSNVVAIAAGSFHCIALKSNGTMVFWGDDSANQANAPAGLTNVVAISAGYLHSLALTTLPIAALLSPAITNLTGNVPQTNTLIGGGIYFYQVTVPTNADFATNSLLFADNLPLEISWTTNVPPTIGGANDAFLFSGTNGTAVLTTNGIPPLVPGGTYYLGVDNTNSVSVTYGIEVSFHFFTNSASTNTLPVTNTVPISSIVYTNINGTNGFLLTWFAPSNDLFQVEFTDALGSTNWTTFTNIISYNPGVPATATNAQFNFFDNGTEFPFTGSRFYRLLLFNGSVTVINSSPSSASALPASLVTGPGAQLNGFATPNGQSSAAWFEWGASSSYGNITPPVNIGNGSNVVFLTNVIAGLTTGQAYHFCLVVSNSLGMVTSRDQVFGVGQVVAWGDNSAGETNVPAGLTNVVAVAGGEYLSVALKTDGTVTAWGLDSNGETNVPAGLSNVVAIAAANGFVVALKNDGTVTGWGTLGATARYTYYAGLSNVVAISAGSFNNVAALTQSGNVYANSSSPSTNIVITDSNVVGVTSGYYFNELLLNNGTISQFPAYTNVPPAWTNVSSLSTAYNNHMLALENNGIILDWTNFNFSTYSSVPPAGTNYEAIAAGGDCGMALDNSGLVHVWGDNANGETNIPSGLTNVVAIAGGNSHCLAIQVASFTQPAAVSPHITGASLQNNSAPISATNGFVLQWTASANESFQVQWTTNLTPAITWSNLPGTITSSSGTFSFSDTNAPYGAMKFYRLVVVSP